MNTFLVSYLIDQSSTETLKCKLNNCFDFLSLWHLQCDRFKWIGRLSDGNLYSLFTFRNLGKWTKWYKTNIVAIKRTPSTRFLLLFDKMDKWMFVRISSTITNKQSIFTRQHDFWPFSHVRIFAFHRRWWKTSIYSRITMANEKKIEMVGCCYRRIDNKTVIFGYNFIDSWQLRKWKKNLCSIDYILFKGSLNWQPADCRMDVSYPVPFPHVMCELWFFSFFSFFLVFTYVVRVHWKASQ